MKNIDYAIRKTAEDTGLSEAQVKLAVMSFWSAFYARLTSMDGMTLVVRHVGVFSISRYKLRHYIAKRIAKIRRTRTGSFFSPAKKFEIISSDYQKLQTALRHRNTLAEQYAEKS